ncbi:MAG: hypothetical protein KatS3mg013_1891 [Actinomycetota bacterium]|jgi:predicted nucleic acid-binding Zn ribbon protein|nr:MAG: hypothetical protein KatS3mg013_1891 [Actinomycetota bacterium]
MSDPPLTTCPDCGGELRKVFAPPAITFKGSGFYATDHGKRKAAGSDDGSTGSKGGAAASEGGAPAGTGATSDAGSTPTAGDTSSKEAS